VCNVYVNVVWAMSHCTEESTDRGNLAAQTGGLLLDFWVQPTVDMHVLVHSYAEGRHVKTGGVLWPA
jgi:hypothetical protein